MPIFNTEYKSYKPPVLPIPSMTANTQDWYTASASSLYSWWQPYGAFNSGGSFHSAYIGNASWAYSQIQMPWTAIVTKLTVTSRADDQNNPQYPASLYLQWSNDWSNWTNIWSTITPWFTAINQTKSWDITGETTGYSYLRLNLQAGSSWYVAIKNWNMEWNNA